MYSGSLVGCEDQTLQLDVQGGDEERKREISVAKCKDRIVCFHLINQETQFCGRSPRERVNHVYLVALCG
jgi:hypothetical protein